MIRVIGIGSPFGDDRVGLHVAELLKKSPKLKIYLNQSLDIQIYDRPGLALITAMEEIKTLYLVDALKSHAHQIGQIYRIENDHQLGGQVLPAVTFFSTHGFGVLEALQLAQVLGKIPAKTIIFGITIDFKERQDSLSPVIAKACDTLADQLIQELLIQLG